jgi:hypothetical protein
VLTSHLAGQESAYTYGKSNQDQWCNAYDWYEVIVTSLMM